VLLFSPLMVTIPVVVGLAVWSYRPSTPYEKWLTAFPWQAAAALVAVAGAITAALITWWWQNEQRQMQEEQFNTRMKTEWKLFDEKQKTDRDHFERQAREDRKRFEDQIRADRERFEAQARAGRKRFESQTLDAWFKDAQDRFASGDPIQRAYAAIRLAEMAEQQSPEWSPTSAEPEGKRYPFFPRAASILAAALHMEPKQAVRDEIGKAVRRMAGFAAASPQPDLYLLIRELADANRSAKHAFADVLGEYRAQAATAQGADLGRLIGYAPFFEKQLPFHLYADAPAARRELTLTCLSGLAASRRGRAAATRHSERHWGTAAEAIAERRGTLLDDVECRAGCLIDTRDALVTALLRLSSLPKLPSDLREFHDRRQPQLDLSKCFLAGAKLEGAQLEGADLGEGYLQGAILTGARFDGANLRSAQLQGAGLDSTCLVGANKESADFTRAAMGRAEVDEYGWWGARVTREQLRDTSGGAKVVQAILDSIGKRAEAPQPRSDSASADQETASGQEAP
jgi:hypothetical protein